MNAKQLIAFVSIAMAAGSALADDITPDGSAQALSTKSRAEVKAEVQRAAAAGELLAAGEEDFGVPTVRSTTLARAEVKAEVLAARARGELIPAGELLVAQHPVRTDGAFRFSSLASR
ncbi:MAG: DUF4148 domain-containing protein [Pseudomonadota bacterium]